MLKRVMSSLVAIGALAILTSEAGAGCAGVVVGGVYRVYCSGSVICDLAFQGGGPDSTANCEISIPGGTDILLLCVNNGGTIAPGGNVRIANTLQLGASGPATPADKKNGLNKAVIEVDLLQGDLATQLDNACKTAFNSNWSAINAVPCQSNNTASLTSGGHTQTFNDGLCTLPVQQCDSTQTEVLDFNKKTGAFETIDYVCPNQ